VSRAPALLPQVKKALNDIVQGDEDASLRYMARESLAGLALRGKANETKESAKLKILAGDFDFTDVIDLEVLQKCWKGEAKPEEVKRLQEKYIKFVDEAATRYTGGNAIATKRLHNKGWPGTLKDKEAKAFYSALAGLKPGVSRREALKILKLPQDEPPEEHIVNSLGARVYRLAVDKEFEEEVEGPFGFVEKEHTVVLIFVNDKLRLVQATPD